MKRMMFHIALACAALAASIAHAQPPATPLLDGFLHSGVSSCSTAGCHGDQVSGAGAGAVVGQNEYFRWRAPGIAGAHSRAYAVLQSPHSQRIARNLGIGAAHQSPECLACHSDFPPADKRSERFQASDGVGCEACHGGSENWLAFHRIGAGHAQNIAMGLYPTEEPEARGALCLSCHLGSEASGQFVSHRLMGAGHPRLKFELDLYTTMQQHHTVDADYRERKTVAAGAKVWAVGQALSLTRMLDLLTDERIGTAGAFPELAFFDCHACHQPISAGDDDLSWRANPLRALGPGVPVLNDANLIMLIAAARVIDPVVADTLEDQGRALHAASQLSRTNFLAAARRLAATATDFSAQLAATDFENKAAVRQILGEVVDASLSERYTNYAAAEQALFAVQRLGADLGLGQADFTAAVERAGRSVESPYTYDQAAFRRALGDIKALAP